MQGSCCLNLYPNLFFVIQTFAHCDTYLCMADGRQARGMLEPLVDVMCLASVVTQEILCMCRAACCLVSCLASLLPSPCF